MLIIGIGIIFAVLAPVIVAIINAVLDRMEPPSTWIFSPAGRFIANPTDEQRWLIAHERRTFGKAEFVASVKLTIGFGLIGWLLVALLRCVLL